MSEPKKAKAFPIRKILSLLFLAAVFGGILAWAMISGKGHTILVDNKAVSGLEAFRFAEATLDGRKVLEFGRGDRDKYEVQGQRHRISVDLQNGSEPVVREIKLPYGQRMVLLSLPKLVAGLEPYFEPFVVVNEPRTAAESAPQESFTSPDIPTTAENFLDPVAPILVP